jgi:hypothetical protein
MVLLEQVKHSGYNKKQNKDPGVFFAGMFEMTAACAKDEKSYTVRSDHRKKPVFGLRVLTI